MQSEQRQRRARRALVVIAVATAVGLAEAVQAYLGAAGMGRPLAFTRAMSATMPSWYVLAALLPGVLVLSRRFPPDAGAHALMVHVPAAAAFSLLHLVVASWLSDYVFFRDMPISYWPNLQRLFGVYFLLNTLFYAAIVGIHRGVLARRQLRAREREAAEMALETSRLETSLTRARLDSLRMQLNPHFLFNTLNTVSVLAMKGERQRVVRMLTMLSDLLRLSLDQSEPLVTLREEVEFLDRYLEIEQVRFGERLILRRDVEPAALDAEVPSLLLQPLFENAIRHGIARRPGAGRIDLHVRVLDDALHITVADTGRGFSAEALAGGHDGIGLANTRARLAQLYGERHMIELSNAPEGGGVVRVRLPFALAAEPVAEYVDGMRSA
ncbi:MAG: sensor histidine kinase [Longimicrobiales bacterium]